MTTSSPVPQTTPSSSRVPAPITTADAPAGSSEDDPLPNPAPLPPKSPKRALLNKIAPLNSPVHDPTSPKFTPSPGKRTEKMNIAAGLSASKGSKGSHTKKKAPLHHLHPPAQPHISFSNLVEIHGSFAKARQALHHKVEDHQHVEIKARETEYTDSHLGLLFDETVAISGVSGPQPVNTPFQKMEEVTQHAKDLKSGEVTATTDEDILLPIRRSWFTGDVLLPQKNLTDLPTYMATTLHLQLPPPTKITLARNSLTALLTAKTPNISCSSFSYTTTLDVGTNNIVHLPECIGLMQNMTRLNLENNRLGTLPDEFLTLTNLQVLKLNKNNFKQLPKYIGKLVSLVHLDLANNVLDILPPTLPSLRKLEYLDVTSNGLAHLGIQPIMQEYEDRMRAMKNKALLKLKSETGVWDTVVDPKTGHTCYYNRLTETASNTKPIEASIEDEDGDPDKLPARLDRFINQKDEPNEYIERKKLLAQKGVPEWDLSMDVSSGQIYYTNAVSNGILWTLPEPLDSLGGCVSMKHFKANQNLIRSLPSSMTRMTKIEILEVKNNYLGALPDAIGNLTKLRIMKLTQNEIKALPDSMESCVSLTELQLTSNYIARFPDFINKCAKLTRLMLGNNFLKILPYTLGFLTSMTELQLFNNPLTSPPYDIVMEGLEKTLYFCRQMYWARINGPTPVVRIHATGIGDECLELEPEFRDRLQQMIKDSEENSSLELQLLNLKRIPETVFKLEGLKNFDLSRNDFSQEPLYWGGYDEEEVNENLSTVTSVYLKSCKMHNLDSTIQVLKNVVELNLEDNRLEYLPPQFTRLRRLQFLNLAKNRLYELPPDIGNMSDLRELNLDINRLELFPDSLGGLRHLEVLTCNRNWIYQLPDSITELRTLQELSLDGNFISTLPKGIGNLNLVTLKLAHNRLEYLEDDCLRPNLINTLSVLWVSSNNLIELPHSFVDMKSLDDMKIEYNPMRSPPMDLVQEGMQTVMQYCRIRASRVNELAELLEEVGFETDVANFTPDAKDVLTGETGFLTPDDLREFDAAVNSFCNGKYYLYPAPAIEMRDKVDDLRFERETVFYHMILEALLRVLADEVKIRSNEETKVASRFSENVLRDDLVRPWGRDREKVNCYAVPINVLLKETKANYFVSEDRESLYDVVKEGLPDTIFEYTEDVLRDAMKNFKSPYGEVAFWDEKVPYDACECIDEKTGEEAKHLPCVVRSVVIVKTIYSAAESKRRADEETVLEGHFTAVEANIQAWIEKIAGVKSMGGEVLSRTKGAKAGLELTKKKIKEVEEKELVHVKDLQKAALQRKKDFEDGKAKVFHKIDTPEEAVKVVQDADKKVKECEASIAALKEDFDRLKKMTKLKRHDKEELCQKDLRAKYCYEAYELVYKRGRELAKQRGWRRPWDGPDGAEFEKYQNAGREEGNPLAKMAGEGGALPGEEEEKGSDSEEEEAEGGGGESAILGIERLLKQNVFDWTNTAEMTQYENFPYTKYKASFGNRVSRFTRGISKSVTRGISGFLEATGM